MPESDRVTQKQQSVVWKQQNFSGSLRVSAMGAAESVWWYGLGAGAGVWRARGGVAGRGVVWKQQKSPTRSN